MDSNKKTKHRTGMIIQDDMKNIIHTNQAVSLMFVYGLTKETRVAQLARAVRVPPQLPMAPVTYCVNVHVWAM